MAKGFIPPHGGYENLLSFQKARVVFDATLCFCERFIPPKGRTYGQMVQAARSGKQNIVEGSQAASTSKETRAQACGRGSRELGGVAARLPGFSADPACPGLGERQP